MKSRILIAFAAAAFAALIGCKSSPPEITHFEAREFERPANLVDLAVLDSGAAPGATKEEYQDGRVVDFLTAGGRIVRVESVEQGVRSRVVVSHTGPRGSAGAKEDLETISEWLEDTDTFKDDIPERRPRTPKLP